MAFSLKYGKSIHLERPAEIIAQDSVLPTGEAAKPNTPQVLPKDLPPFPIYATACLLPPSSLLADQHLRNGLLQYSKGTSSAHLVFF